MGLAKVWYSHRKPSSFVTHPASFPQSLRMGLVSPFQFVLIFREFKNALEAKLKLSHRIARGVRAIAARKTLNRRVGIAVVVSLALLLGSARQASAQTGFPSGCIGYCGNGIVIGIPVTAAAIATVGILLAVNHSRHFLKGCVATGPDGLELETSDSTMYFLAGDEAAIRPGEMVKVHGSHMKKSKDGKAGRGFNVSQLKKDYGPCSVKPAHAAP